MIYKKFYRFLEWNARSGEKYLQVWSDDDKFGGVFSSFLLKRKERFLEGVDRKLQLIFKIVELSFLLGIIRCGRVMADDIA